MAMTAAHADQPAVLVVHGIWDSERRIGPLVEGLLRAGLARVHAFTLRPNDGRAPIAELAAQVAAQAQALCASSGAARVDLVGFSMGALIGRHFVQRGGGKQQVRRFVSISGPHHGTLTAHALPLRGVRDMRPGSALLQDLAGDADPFGPVEVHCIYTPFDLTIVPASSSVLAGARSVHRVPVAVHRWMLHDRRVQALTAELLRAP
jgi:triacylglycerol lipase